MDIDTYNYFTVVLGGFGLVWGFRKGFKSRNNISDFEYLGFSSFWGVVVIIFWQKLIEYSKQLSFVELLKNPYAMGSAFFMYSVVIGYTMGWLIHKIGNKIKGN